MFTDEPEITAMTSLFPEVAESIIIVPMSKPTPERQGKGSSPNSRTALVRYQFKPGQSGNPGGMPKGTPRVDAAYRRLLEMTPEELAVWEPRTGAEILAAEQFKRACNPKAKQTLSYAERISDRTDGPIIRKIHKEDLTQYQVERQRFEAAIDALVEKRGCTRVDVALALATVEASFRKFLEGEDASAFG